MICENTPKVSVIAILWTAAIGKLFIFVYWKSYLIAKICLIKHSNKIYTFINFNYIKQVKNVLRKMSEKDYRI